MSIIKIDGDGGVYTKISDVNTKIDAFEAALIDLAAQIENYKTELTGNGYEAFFSNMSTNTDAQKENIAKYRVLMTDSTSYVTDMESAESGVSF